MPKVKLDKQYLWNGTSYEPGEVEVPEKMVSAYNLTPLTPPELLSLPPSLPIPNAEEPAVQDPPSEEVPPSTPPSKAKPK